MKKCEIHQLYNLEETIAADIFKNVTYPWEVLPKIKDFIVELGNTLDASVYEKRGEVLRSDIVPLSEEMPS